MIGLDLIGIVLGGAAEQELLPLEGGIVQPKLIVAPLLVVSFSCFLASEVGPHTLFFTLTLCLLVGFFAFPLVAFSTLSISLHATLRYSNAYVSSPLRYSTVESHVHGRRIRSSALPLPTSPRP